MQFQFNVSLSENDYYEYNKFLMLRSYYGKKRINTMRSIITVICALVVVLMLFRYGSTFTAFIGAMPMIILFILFQLLLKPYYILLLKLSLKKLNKSEKKRYSPTSVIEFSDECFIETTPETKSEQKYGTIDRISIVDNKVIYLHFNNFMAIILPVSCFETQEQYSEFLEFIKPKCANIDIY